MKWFWNGLLMLAVLGCSSLPRTLSPAADRSLLFPAGTYTHQVSIKPKEGGFYSFRGVVKIAADKIYVVGLSPLQTTVFSVEEDRRTGKVSTQIFQNELKNYRAHLEEFYATLRVFLTLKRTEGAKNVKIYAKTPQGVVSDVGISSGTEPETRVRLVSFDENGIPAKAEIGHPRFEVTVNVVGYEA